MNKATSDSVTKKNIPTKRKVIIALSTVILLVLLAILAFTLPYTVSDGTEKFTGKEAQIAKEAIGDGSYNGPSASPIPNLAIPFKIKITGVAKSDPEKKCSVDERQGITYFVDIDRVTFFGLVKPGYTQPTCVFD